MNVNPHITKNPGVNRRSFAAGIDPESLAEAIGGSRSVAARRGALYTSCMEPDLSEFRPSRLWKRMPVENRIAAAELFWDDEQSTEQQLEAVAALATHMKFRTKSVLGLAPERRAKYLATLPNVSDSIAARALVNYHLAKQRPMMSAFLDRVGIAHDEGLITEENVAKPDPEKLKAAAEEMVAQFPPGDVALYLSTLVSQDPETWGDLIQIPQTTQA